MEESDAAAPDAAFAFAFGRRRREAQTTHLLLLLLLLLPTNQSINLSLKLSRVMHEVLFPSSLDSIDKHKQTDLTWKQQRESGRQVAPLVATDWESQQQQQRHTLPPLVSSTPSSLTLILPLFSLSFSLSHSISHIQPFIRPSLLPLFFISSSHLHLSSRVEKREEEEVCARVHSR